MGPVGRWMVAAVGLGAATAWAGKKPTGDVPPPEVQGAYQAYGAVAKTYSDTYRAANVYGLDEKMWALCDGSAFQPRIDALKADLSKAEARLMEASKVVNTAATSGDLAAMNAATAALQADTAGLTPFVSGVAALRSELDTAAANQPKTIALSALAKTDGTRLQCLFATAGWKKEGAAVGGMSMSGYLYENFDVAQGAKVLNVYVIKPNASAGAGGASPKDVVSRATPDTAFRYDAASNTYVEIRPGDNATPADAKALMAQVITP